MGTQPRGEDVDPELRSQEGDDTSCVSDDFLLDFDEGRLSAEARSRMQEHAARCANCRVLVSSLGLMAPEGSPEDAVLVADPPESDPERRARSTVADGWTPPECFDEFRIERLLGRGAMGAVYQAHIHIGLTNAYFDGLGVPRLAS